MKIDAQTVDEYFDKLPPERQNDLRTIRSLVHQLYPDIEETLQHGMPAFTRGERTICYLASQKNHISLYTNPAVLETYEVELGKLNTGKSCLRFKNLTVIPDGLLEKVLRAAGTEDPSRWQRSSSSA
jgi:uncharacterized protein YdhG (YjbR/CyaY superfamily)